MLCDFAVQFDSCKVIIATVRSATRILLREGLEIGKNCNVILMTYFRLRNLYDVI